MPQVDGVTHHYADVDGLRLHYAEAGAGPPVILAHGWPQHWYAWRHLIGPLAHRYRVICPDARGLGWSQGCGSGAGPTVRRLADDIVGLMDVLGLDRARLVGHDWGGTAGYQACLRHPERVQRFVALATAHPWAALGAPPALFLRPWHLYVLASPGAYRLVRHTRLVEGRLRAWRRHGEFSATEVTTYAATVRSRVGAQATAGFYRDLVLREVPRMLRARTLRLDVPTLHLNGAADALSRGMPHSYRPHATAMTMSEVPDAGHFPAEEQPGTTLRLISDFLAS
jgi:pimeloyl-ACP methyl ester carboxylesterase